MVEKFNLNPSDCRFFESYLEYDGGLDEIKYDWHKRNDEHIASNANWIPQMNIENHIVELFNKYKKEL
ncbi:MAG: hypothetical protein ACOC1K_00510 [Nanoarchaeota archaeon]